MQSALSAAFVVILLAAGVTAQTVPGVEFRTPAQAGGSVSATNATWLLVVFEQTDGGRFTVDFHSPVQDHNFTVLNVGRWHAPEAQAEPTQKQLETQQALSPFGAEARFPDAPGSLYLEGKGIHVEVQGAHLDLNRKPSDDCLFVLATSHERVPYAARYNSLCPPGQAAAVVAHPETDQTMAVRIHADALTVVEWHHAQIACHNGTCPDGGARIEKTAGTPQANITNGIYGFHHLTTTQARVEGDGHASRVYVGAEQLDVAIQGWLRLPLASSPGACAGCLTPADQTLQATGNLTLTGLHVASERTLVANLGGSPSSARFDEQIVNPAHLFASSDILTTSAAVVVGGLALWGLWAWFFSRVETPNDALEHKLRRTILQAIQDHPGIHGRRLAELLNVPHPTIRHHLKFLHAHHLIVAKQQGRNKALFENHGRYASSNLKGIGALQDDHLRRLHGHLLEAGERGIPRPLLVEHAKTAWGWHKTPTYDRLKRLQQAGLVGELRVGGQTVLTAHSPF
ncbi:MAG: Helix-turn-helix domain [Thermoplasmata archaeon]|jgi:predicted transcriptional regulator|nr:Helix-turn-helix domain [Thermoplasmata archaeon]